nr:hypothetical protein [uncultured Fusobacterium sp.]
MLNLSDREKEIIGKIEVHKDFDKIMYIYSRERIREAYFKEIFKTKNYNLSFLEWFKKNVEYIELKNHMYITRPGIKIDEVRKILDKIFKAEGIKEKDIKKPGEIYRVVIMNL